ncbi:hypothetical protein [Nitrosomonas sp. PY1]|uniref:hypothetical protein n=1 Tax=Nitrosomonas sp. PY1 TaxID=1803906 RepID=UPI001FC8D602|nr:hypothetical protein [Nitrosomonas sp. PY1]
MTKIKLFIFELFEKYQGFRRLIVLYVCWLTTYLSVESMSLISHAISKGSNLLELSGVFLTVYGPLGAVMAFVSKLYWESRDKETDQ